MDAFIYQSPINRNNDSTLYRINRGGISNLVDREFDIQREHAYPYCVIHYIISGAGSLTYQGREYSLRGGQLFMLDAFEAHRYRTDPDRQLAVDWIEFTGGDSLMLVRRIIAARSPVIGMPGSGDCDRYLLKILSLLQKDEHKYLVLVSKLVYSMLLAMLYRNSGKYPDELPDESSEFIEKVTGYIVKHLDEELNIEKLSKLCSFNPCYFAKLFRKVTGVTPAKYVLGKRIDKAKELLTGSDQSIEAISDSLGFCNPSHFIRVFKTTENMTPSEYRKQGLVYRMYRV